MRNDERRRAPRVRVAAIATLETRGSLDANNQAVGSVRDLSRLGIGVETGQPPRPGQTVILRLALDETIRELRTHVTRVQQRRSHFFDVGLDFSACGGDDLLFLDEVLAAVERTPLT